MSVGCRLLVATSVGLAAREVVEELRPGGFGLAHERDVAQSLEELFLDRNEGPAHDGEDSQLAQPDQDLADALLLHGHARHADDVVLAQRLPVDLLDVLVEQVHVVIAAQPGHRRERAGDHRAALVARIERQRELEAPVGRLEAGIDQADLQPPHRDRMRPPRSLTSGYNSVLIGRLSGRFANVRDMGPRTNAAWVCASTRYRSYADHPIAMRKRTRAENCRGIPRRPVEPGGRCLATAPVLTYNICRCYISMCIRLRPLIALGNTVMTPVKLTRQLVLADRQGRTFTDVLNDPEQPFDEVLDFFNDPGSAAADGRVGIAPQPPAAGRRGPRAGIAAGRRSVSGSQHPRRTKRLRQAVGVVVRMIMELRGWQKTGKKGSLGVRAARGRQCRDTGHLPQHRRIGLLVFAGGALRASRRHAVSHRPRRAPRVAGGPHKRRSCQQTAKTKPRQITVTALLAPLEQPITESEYLSCLCRQTAGRPFGSLAFLHRSERDVLSTIAATRPAAQTVNRDRFSVPAGNAALAWRFDRCDTSRENRPF